MRVKPFCLTSLSLPFLLVFSDHPIKLQKSVHGSMGSTLIGDDYLISAVTLGLITGRIGAMIELVERFSRDDLSKSE